MAAADSSLSKKSTLIMLQWLVLIASCYLMLFENNRVSEDPFVYSLVLAFFITTWILYHLPVRVFNYPWFDAVLLVTDTLLISAAIYTNRNGPWDLLLFYFFILFLAAVGAEMVQIVLGSVIICLVYGGVLIQQKVALGSLGADIFVRLPFLFGISILYGYLSENARKEKMRAETAEQKERLMMELVAALAHDIKNPLGVIMGYTGIMVEEVTTRADDKSYLHPLQRIQENSQRIVNLVTGLLQASKAEAGNVEASRRPVSINTMVKEVARAQETDLEKKRLTLELNLDERLPEIHGDKDQLERVFWNLIGNAIKFTPAGGTITVNSGRDDGFVRVAVKDTGIGISKEELPLLFSQFQRLKGAERTEGTGLGLFIVKTIIEAHKGTVQAESDYGQGSTFTVRIPIH